ncbi:MAG: hypothetical protein IJW03_04955 [Clostridia bacterium]|nr:hypothetical protein [Clostridia bacterium]
MGKKIFLEPGVDAIVVALCADYERRYTVLRDGGVGHGVEMEYKYLNYKMFDAAAEVVGESSAETVISEIGTRVGYAKCENADVSERIYKERKREVKINIARKLRLCD